MTEHTDPAADPTLTVRVYPLDDPTSPTARRWLRTDDHAGGFAGSQPTPWTAITGCALIGAGYLDLGDDAVAGYPVQSLAELITLLGHPAPDPNERSTT